jgi:hypothetical protein
LIAYHHCKVDTFNKKFKNGNNFVLFLILALTMQLDCRAEGTGEF